MRQIKSNLTVSLTQRGQEGFAERTVACESVIISVVWLLQRWGFGRWNFAHRHFTTICKRYSCRCAPICFGVRLIRSTIWTFGCSSSPWAAGLAIVQELVFEEMLDPHRQTWGTFCSLEVSNDLVVNFPLHCCSPLDGEDVQFSSAFWKSSWWVALSSPYIPGCTSTRWGAGEERKALDLVKGTTDVAAWLFGVSAGHWFSASLNALRKCWSKHVYVSALKMWIWVFWSGQWSQKNHQATF